MKAFLFYVLCISLLNVKVFKSNMLTILPILLCISPDDNVAQGCGNLATSSFPSFRQTVSRIENVGPSSNENFET